MVVEKKVPMRKKKEKRQVSRPAPGTAASKVWGIIDFQRKFTGDIDYREVMEIGEGLGIKQNTIKVAIYRYRRHHGIHTC